MKVKSVLILTPFYGPNLGGVETHLDDLSTFLQKKRFPQTVITYQPLTSNNIKAPFVQKEKHKTVYRLPWVRHNLFYHFETKPLLQFPYLFTGIFIFCFFYLLFNSKKIDIIHGHGLTATVAGFILSKIFRKKTVVSLHTIYKFKDRRRLGTIMKFFFLRTDVILVLAQGARDDLLAIGVPFNKMRVYTHWLDLKEKFYPQNQGKCRKRLNLERKGFLALFVGRLSPEKGVKLLLETIPKVTKDINFVIVGGGPMKPETEKITQKFKNVKYVGPVSNNTLPDYYNAADVLLWGSVDQDYFGRVTIEALGCGLPVIIPSKTEYFGRLRPVKIDFPQGKVGYILDTNPEIVAKKITELSKSRKLSQLRNNCRKYALERFSEKNANIFLKAYLSK